MKGQYTIMPVFLVDEKILNKYNECVVCPARSNNLYVEGGIWKKIFEKSGYRELLSICFSNASYVIGKPFMTSGLKLAKHIIHVITPYLSSNNQTFEADIYNSYHEIFKLIIKNKFSNVVFAPLSYSYKRVGNKFSLRTCYFFLRHFMLLYNYTGNIYVLSSTQTVDDEINDYTSNYVSLSYPISKRHTPLDYPFEDRGEFFEFINNTNKEIDDEYILKSNYNFPFSNDKMPFFINLRKKLNISDAIFCHNANITTYEFKKIYIENYIPEKYTLIGILIALNLSIIQINEYLTLLLNCQMDENILEDKIIIDTLNNKSRNIVVINKELFINNCKQIGSKSPYL